MMWYPGIDWPDGPYGHYEPAKNSIYTRYCTHCECKQTTKDEPCWQCGGELTTTKPRWWPPEGTQQTVLQGGSWSPGDEEREAQSAPSVD